MILDACVPIFKMFHPSPNTARTHAHTSISTLKSLVNFCSRISSLTRNSMIARCIVVGHFVRNDIGHVMQAIDITRHTTAGSIYHPTLLRLLFPVCMQKMVAHDFRYDPRIFIEISMQALSHVHDVYRIQTQNPFGP